MDSEEPHQEFTSNEESSESMESSSNNENEEKSTGTYNKASSEEAMNEKQASVCFNPFSSRKLPFSCFLSDKEAVVLILNCIFGSGVFFMPISFRRAGNIYSLASMFVTTVICAHCNYLWVKCNHELCYRTRISSLEYDDIIILGFGRTTTWIRKYSGCLRFTVRGIFFVYFFWTATHYLRITRRSIQTAIFGGKHSDHQSTKTLPSMIITGIIMIPVVIMGLLPNMKVLAKFSFVIVSLAIICILAIFLYMIQENPPEIKEPFGDRVLGVTQCIALIVYSLQVVGILIPVENFMQDPHHLVSGFFGFGINNIALTVVAIIYAAFGYTGYKTFGDETCYFVIDNISEEHWMKSTVHFTLGVAFLGSVSIPLYILYDIAWGIVYNTFSKRPLLVSIITRILIIAALSHTTYALLETFSGVITGVMGISMPAVLETVIYWNKPRHIPYLRKPSVLTITSVHEATNQSLWFTRFQVLKNFLVFIFGIFVMLSSMFHGIRYFLLRELQETC